MTNSNIKELLGKIVNIRWIDSYMDSGWREVGDFSAGKLEIQSLGKVIYEDENVVSLAHNFASETDYTPQQANGIMTIPKLCILEVTCVCSPAVSAKAQ